MAKVKLNIDIGPLAAALFFVLFGLNSMGVLSVSGTVIGILALITGICQLFDLS